MDKTQVWDKVITTDSKKNRIDFKELWEYREMALVLVKKNFIASYKQTILGPAWAFINPFVTSIVFTFIFGNIANLSTDGIPQQLFYFCMILFWGYFSGCLSSTSNTFLSNAYLMSKIYFPRFIMPIISVISNFISFGIQFLLFILMYIFYLIIGANIHIEPTILLFPLFFLQFLLLSLGLGSIFASITIKYRDIGTVIGFFIQLWMYATPVAYSSSVIPSSLYFIYHLNPVTNTLEWITYSLFGVGNPSVGFLIYSIIISIIIFFIGLRFFKKTEKTFIDII